MLAKKRKKIPKAHKSPKRMERHLKGIANHHRINILLIIDEKKGISLEEIIEKTKANAKTIGEHTRKLYQAGLVNKKYKGRYVVHELSPYGKIFVRFLKSFSEAIQKIGEEKNFLPLINLLNKND